MVRVFCIFPWKVDGDSYQIDVRFVRVIEFQYDIGKLPEDLVVPGHVGREDAPYDAFPYGSVGRWVQGRQDVAFQSFEDAKGHRAMVIL